MKMFNKLYMCIKIQNAEPCVGSTWLYVRHTLEYKLPGMQCQQFCPVCQPHAYIHGPDGPPCGLPSPVSADPLLLPTLNVILHSIRSFQEFPPFIHYLTFHTVLDWVA